MSPDELRELLSPLMDHCCVLAGLVGVTAPLGLALLGRGPYRRVLLLFGEKLKSQPTNSSIRQIIAILTLLSLILPFAGVLAFPFYLKWYYGVASIFSFQRDYRPCFDVYIAAALVGGGLMYWRLRREAFSFFGESGISNRPGQD